MSVPKRHFVVTSPPLLWINQSVLLVGPNLLFDVCILHTWFPFSVSTYTSKGASLSCRGFFLGSCCFPVFPLSLEANQDSQKRWGKVLFTWLIHCTSLSGKKVQLNLIFLQRKKKDKILDENCQIHSVWMDVWVILRSGKCVVRTMKKTTLGKNE